MTHSTFLILRTYLSLVVARIDGRIVKDLVAANGKDFLQSLTLFFAISIPATYTNSMIKYCQSKLSIAVRTTLTKYLQDLYMSNNNYYKAINLDIRLGNSCDQLITTDVKRFADAAANLYSNLGKPVLDLVIFNYQLAKNIGTRGMYGIIVNYFLTATLMSAVRPQFGRFAAEEAKLEGDYRMAHSRLITNAEEISFYNGAKRELSILDKTYNMLIKHINHVYKVRIAYNMFEDFLIKYTWSAIGLLLAAIPVFFPEFAGSSQKYREALLMTSSATSSETAISNLKQGSRTQSFVTNKRLLLGLADAGGRLMLAGKDLSELAGYTHRVSSLLKVLKDLDVGKFVTGAEGSKQLYNINDTKGAVEYGHEGIRFKNVPIVTPSADTVLVRDLSLSIQPGDHIMITGPNGSGKTSVLRVIASLWPVYSGLLQRPAYGINEIMYIPQRPYLSIGTLRDQIIYPHDVNEMRRSGRTDEELNAILKIVYLDYIPAREGGYDTIKNWKDVFSGGEKQRVQIARLFYHHPRFVVLDEATSAVSPDVEALMYASAQEEGITVITISHRYTLSKYHSLLLKIGEGTDGKEWFLESISSSNTLIESVDNEIKKIRTSLGDTDVLKTRLKAINKELGLNIPDEGGAIGTVKRTTI